MMTNCSICYEEFHDGYDFETAGSDLDISISLECETPKCNYLVCHGCEVKLQNQVGRKNVIKCPFCRKLHLKNHFKWNVLAEDLYLWKEKQKRKLKFGIYCKEELIKGYMKLIENTQKQLKEFNEEMENLQREMDEKVEKLAIYN